MIDAAIYVFWACFALTAYTYFGYPAVIGGLARLFGRPHRIAAHEPSVTSTTRWRSTTRATGSRSWCSRTGRRTAPTPSSGAMGIAASPSSASSRAAASRARSIWAPRAPAATSCCYVMRTRCSPATRCAGWSGISPTRRSARFRATFACAAPTSRTVPGRACSTVSNASCKARNRASGRPSASTAAWSRCGATSTCRTGATR